MVKSFNKWQKKKLGTVLKRVKKPVSVSADAKYQEIGIRSHGKGIFHKNIITGRELGNKSVFWVEPDCLVLNIVFAWEQAVAKTTNKEAGFIASHRFPMYQPLDNKADIDFLLQLFNTKYGKFLLELASPGGAGRNKTLGQKEFAALEVLLPPAYEQRAIAAILSTWDKGIQQLTSLLEAKRERKCALMQRLLTGKQRLLKFEEQEWEEVPLGKICKIKKGEQLNKDTLTKDGAYPAMSGGIVPSGFTEKWNEEANTVIISEGGNSCGFVGWMNKRFWCGGHCYALKEVNANTRYLFYTLKNSEHEIMRLRVGSGLPNVQKGDLEDFTLLLPTSIEEQTCIAAILSAADHEITQLEQKLDTLREQKKGLMQQLLTGKKRVNIQNKEAA
jgi:type I restriction enzyme S subunit